jgi:hypothetical protein
MPLTLIGTFTDTYVHTCAHPHTHIRIIKIKINLEKADALKFKGSREYGTVSMKRNTLVGKLRRKACGPGQPDHPREEGPLPPPTLKLSNIQQPRNGSKTEWRRSSGSFLLRSDILTASVVPVRTAGLGPGVWACARPPGLREPMPGLMSGGAHISSAFLASGHLSAGDELPQGTGLAARLQAVGSNRRRHFALGAGWYIQSLIFIFPFLTLSFSSSSTLPVKLLNHSIYLA